jgi:hypothetical protein
VWKSGVGWVKAFAQHRNEMRGQVRREVEGGRICTEPVHTPRQLCRRSSSLCSCLEFFPIFR